jgi:long-chain acyl-CoA synthetase
VQLKHDDAVAASGAIDHTHFLYALVHALARGATVDLRTVDNVAWGEATVMDSVPTIAADLVQRAEQLPRIRVVLSSGAAWSPSARRQLLELLPTAARVNDFYGTGEMSFVSVSDGTGPDGSLGRPFPGVSVRTVANDGTPTAAGEDGLIEVTSDMLFSGYLDESGETAPIDTWVTAGDHGHLDDDGFLFIAGRRSRMFTRGGLNVEPEAVERILAEHPGVTAAACVPRRSTRWGSVPVAFVASSVGVTSRDLDQWCKERLDALHRPVGIEILSAVPVTHRGKPDYEALERLAARDRRTTNAGR